MIDLRQLLASPREELTQPTSGLRDPSLSGLALGPQGMGFGGGESLMGGGPRGFGGGDGGGLGGLDLSQLLAQLQAAPGVTGAGLGTGIGAGSLGGFGAGGPMGQELPGALPTASQQGQAGLGAANTTAQLLGLIKEGTGLGKALLSLFPKGPTPTDLQGLNLPELTAFSPMIGANLSSLEQLQATNPGLFSLTGNVSATPALDPSKFAGAFGGQTPFNVQGIETLGPGGATALSGEFGPAGLGVPGVTPGLQNIFSLPGLEAGLAGAGGLFRAVTSPTTSGKAFGAAETAASPLVFSQPEIGIPVEIGLNLLDALTGGGGFFGGGGPSKDWLSFGSRVAAGLPRVKQAGVDFTQAILNAQTPQDLESARQTFLNTVEGIGVGGFASRGMPPGWVVPELPGATGTAHEGGLIWNPNDFNSQLNELYSGTLASLQNPRERMALQQRLIPLLQQSILSGGGTGVPQPITPVESGPPPPYISPFTDVGL